MMKTIDLLPRNITLNTQTKKIFIQLRECTCPLQSIHGLSFSKGCLNHRLKIPEKISAFSKGVYYILQTFINTYEGKEKTNGGEKAICPFKMVQNQDYWFNQFNYLSLKMVNACLNKVFHVSPISKSQGPIYDLF